MKNIKEYFNLMVDDGWLFHNPYDESMKYIYFGTKGEYKAYVNLKNGRIELWYDDKEWIIKPPKEYSFMALDESLHTCDSCGEIQVTEHDFSTPEGTVYKFCWDCI